jgi:hypothetical protein
LTDTKAVILAHMNSIRLSPENPYWILLVLLNITFTSPIVKFIPLFKYKPRLVTEGKY